MAYLYQAPSAASWRDAYLKGDCNDIQSVFWQPKPVEELYDTENDPWEVNNLAGDPAYENVLEEMRAACSEWSLKIHDTGFIPEAGLVDRLGNTPAYDYMRSGQVNLQEIMTAAEVATMADPENLNTLRGYLKSDESAIRYWGATGLLVLGEKAATAKEDLLTALNDESANVVAAAAEALYNLGARKEAEKGFITVLGSPNKFACCHALNAMNCIGMESTPQLEEALINMLKSRELKNTDRWNLVAGAEWLMNKWDIDPKEYGIKY